MGRLFPLRHLDASPPGDLGVERGDDLAWERVMSGSWKPQAAYSAPIARSPSPGAAGEPPSSSIGPRLGLRPLERRLWSGAPEPAGEASLKGRCAGSDRALVGGASSS